MTESQSKAITLGLLPKRLRHRRLQHVEPERLVQDARALPADLLDRRRLRIAAANSTGRPGRSRQISRATSAPFIPGIAKSSTTSCGRRARSIASAAGPSAASTTRWPKVASDSASIARKSSSSSTTITRAPSPAAAPASPEAPVASASSPAVQRSRMRTIVPAPGRLSSRTAPPDWRAIP